MAQQRINLEGSRWLTELQAALGDELVDVRYSIEGEGVDFVVVYLPGQKQPAVERFLAALRAAPDCPPFDIYLNEQGQPMLEPLGEYRSVSAEPIVQ
jgi:hypothetical protein